MEIYIIYFNESETSKKYIGTIYRNSISSSIDRGDAIEFNDKDTAIAVSKYLNTRDNVTKFKVMCIKTTVEEVVE